MSLANALRVFFIQLLFYLLTAQEALYEVLQEVPTKEHVDPWIATTVQAGQEGSDRYDSVLRFCQEKAVHCLAKMYNPEFQIISSSDFKQEKPKGQSRSNI